MKAETEKIKRCRELLKGFGPRSLLWIRLKAYVDNRPEWLINIINEELVYKNVGVSVNEFGIDPKIVKFVNAGIPPREIIPADLNHIMGEDMSEDPIIKTITPLPSPRWWSILHVFTGRITPGEWFRAVGEGRR